MTPMQWTGVLRPCTACRPAFSPMPVQQRAKVASSAILGNEAVPGTQPRAVVLEIQRGVELQAPRAAELPSTSSSAYDMPVPELDVPAHLLPQHIAVSSAPRGRRGPVDRSSA